MLRALLLGLKVVIAFERFLEQILIAPFFDDRNAASNWNKLSNEAGSMPAGLSLTLGRI